MCKKYGSPITVTANAISVSSINLDVSMKSEIDAEFSKECS